jgi:hypothetical protein
MNVFRISTSAWDEEDFYVLTSLDAEKIKYERENEIMYDNEDYILSLQQKYKRATVVMHQYIELIEF